MPGEQKSDGGQSANPIAAVVDAFKGILPPPNEVFTELHGAVTTMQSLAPDIHKMANMVEPLRDLATAMKGFNLQDIRELTKALNGAKETGEKLLSHFK